MKPPSSTSTSMKIKTLTHTLIYAQLCRLVRVFSEAKSIIVQIYKENKPIKYLISNSKATKKKHKKLFFGSFRLHYNWCSSHVTPVPSPVLEGCTAPHLYYDSTWSSVIPTEQCDRVTVESQLSGYLQWLEEKKVNSTGETDMNEIDKLAEMFIADCYEKFRLEKQESYRRFQEMMARSV
ncbi:putative DNA-binding protein RAV1 [Hibiscus syriacus]|uniref:DNA-binding protein RAV1 n=1 Tax=Hibiscus syriacus TaxID=106335 RepID=A0A6A3CL01_HIBSY|nr:uncharacterized protein LOC120175121 [Hibiscus syriacus]KAE8729823.1 putative DNA-binding protein RAV1 [Hibiscus syriacus]